MLPPLMVTLPAPALMESVTVTEELTGVVVLIPPVLDPVASKLMQSTATTGATTKGSLSGAKW